MALVQSFSKAKERVSAKPWQQLDFVLLGAVFALSLLGCVMVYSASRTRLEERGLSQFYYLERQIGFVLVGFVLMFLIMSVDYRKYKDFAALIYIVMVGMLFLVLTPIGSSQNGTQGWFPLPGGFQLQPAEFSKFFLIIVLASYISSQESFGLKELLKSGIIAIIPFVLVMLQPDLGTALVIIVITLGMVSVAGIQARYMIAISLIVLTGVVGTYQMGMIKQYQLDRITVFLNPQSDVQGSAYNLDQSKAAIGNGGILGKGLFQGEQTKLSYVPEQHTDFIFTAIGEELGFLGSLTVLGLLGVVAWRMWRISRSAPDFAGTLMCIGVVSMFVFHVFENIGMTMGILPITGIPLPFLSYGGSSILLMFMATGLVANVYMHRFE